MVLLLHVVFSRVTRVAVYSWESGWGWKVQDGLTRTPAVGAGYWLGRWHSSLYDLFMRLSLFSVTLLRHVIKLTGVSLRLLNLAFEPVRLDPKQSLAYSSFTLTSEVISFSRLYQDSCITSPVRFGWWECKYSQNNMSSWSCWEQCFLVPLPTSWPLMKIMKIRTQWKYEGSFSFQVSLKFSLCTSLLSHIFPWKF